jgi:twitching motility two-component system response regulator PilH
MRILVVEDDDASLHLARRVAEAMGHTVLTAVDGRQGLETALAELPELVLLDLRLPEMTGFEVVQRLRRDPSTRGMRVVAVSAIESVDGGLALVAGCDELLQKPYEPERLREVIRRHTR